MFRSENCSTNIIPFGAAVVAHGKTLKIFFVCCYCDFIIIKLNLPLNFTSFSIFVTCLDCLKGTLHYQLLPVL